MHYGEAEAGRVAREPSMAGRVDDPATFHTFDLVEEQLVGAMLLWRRAPDRERGWMAVRALWPDIRRPGSEERWWDVDGELNLTGADRPEPRPLPLTRAEVGEMNRIGEWLGLVPEEDRRIVVLAVLALASGRKRVPWSRLLKPLGMKRGAGAIEQAYRRSIGMIAFRLNGHSEAEARRLVQRRGTGWQDVLVPKQDDERG